MKKLSKVFVSLTAAVAGLFWRLVVQYRVHQPIRQVPKLGKLLNWGMILK
jgi:hypothetical protein